MSASFEEHDLDKGDPLRFAQWMDSYHLISEGGLMDPPDSLAQWNIHFDVLFGDWVLGSDQGILWFDDQNLYVLGQITSFAVPGHRFRNGLSSRADCVEPLQKPYVLRFKVDPAQTLGLQFNIDSPLDEYLRDVRSLQEAIRACIRTSDPFVEGQLPPLYPSANAHSRSFLTTLLVRYSTYAALSSLAMLVCVALVATEMRIAVVLDTLLFLVMFIPIVQVFSPKIKAALAAMGSLKYYESERGG